MGETKMFFNIFSQNIYSNKNNSHRNSDSSRSLPAKYAWRTFLFSSTQGSITVEAALVIPLFTFFLVTMIYFFNIMYIQITFQSAMEEAARKVSSIAYMYEDNDYSVLSEILMKKIFLTDDVKKIADSSYIKNGSDGIKNIPISITGNSDDIDFVISYNIKLPFISDNIVSIKVNQRVLFHPFTGVDIHGETGDFSQTVYVTAEGDVYHTNKYCSYLTHYHEIFFMEGDDPVTWENAKGYTSCTLCADGVALGPNCFLARESKVYHTDIHCIYIDRIIYEITMDEIGSLSLCTRCRKGVNND